MNDHVQIILGTFNGERFLRAQLDSLLKQSHSNWSLLVSDDGSTDNTLAIIADFMRANPSRSVKVIHGPQQGFAKNFLYALDAASPAPFFAFCDQDDLWLPHRLSAGIGVIGTCLQPCLAGGRTQYISATGTPLGRSPLFGRKPSFGNALVQSLFGGNTITMNQAMRDLVIQTIPNTAVVSHDWWLYLLCEGAGGFTHYLPEPSVLYRQHDHNTVGSNTAVRQKLSRLQWAFSGGFKGWIDANMTALQAADAVLQPPQRALLHRFAATRQAPLYDRIDFCAHRYLYRQTLAGDVGLTLLHTTGLL